MTKLKDGGPAFPNIADKVGYYASGMTLRQWYAGMALQGYLAMHADTECDGPKADEAVITAFRFADAMIRYEEKESQ